MSYPVPFVQTYQPMGRLHVRFEGHDAVRDYRRELDMDSAIARVTYRIGEHISVAKCLPVFPIRSSSCASPAIALGKSPSAAV